MTDEKKLFKAIRLNKGKEEVFRYIYNKYKPLVFFVCSKFLKSEFDINDAVEETFIELFKNPLGVGSSLKVYLSVSAKHNCLDMLRRQAKRPTVELDRGVNVACGGLSVEESVCSHDAFNRMVKLMQEILPNEDVDIILLHVTEGFNFEEIALKKEQNVKTVKSKYYRALKKLKIRMEK